MDLSGLKWPIIIIVIVGIGWLLSSGGVDWMVKNATKAAPGEDAARDAKDEARLSSLAGYQIILWRYRKAANIMNMALSRYGTEGKNYWYNEFRLAKCYEKMGRTQEAYAQLQKCIRVDASQYHEKVPNNDNLSLRAAKLREMHGQDWGLRQ